MTISAFEPCTVVSVNDRARAKGPPSIGLFDLDPINQTTLTFVKSAIERHASLKGVPLLYLSRRQGDAALARAKSLGATAVRSRSASPHKVLFIVRRPVGARTPAVCRPSPSVVSVNIRHALSIYTDVIRSLRQGGPIPIDGLEHGADVVLAAVGGVQIAVRLDMARSWDDSTHRHDLSVASFAVSLATAMGGTLHHQRWVGKAASLHDIRKLTISADRLDEQWRPTSAGMEIVRTHSTAGHDMPVRKADFTLVRMAPRQDWLMRHSASTNADPWPPPDQPCGGSDGAARSARPSPRPGASGKTPERPRVDSHPFAGGQHRRRPSSGKTCTRSAMTYDIGEDQQAAAPSRNRGALESAFPIKS